jgi:SAM-dependent methyltransferase
MSADGDARYAPEIVDGLLREFAGNDWFINQCWPENKQRVLRMLRDTLERLPVAGARVLDTGCANGYVSYLFAKAGYSVTATDSWAIPERDEMFARIGVRYFASNLNALRPFPHLGPATFDAVICGEVFEHILNHPLGLLKEFHRILRHRGVLILTTPNPSTLMNALRIVLDRYSLWGTNIFIEKPKLVDGNIIDQGDVHYREYTTREVRQALEAAGFAVEKTRYMGMGISNRQAVPKKILKSIFARTLMTKRLFASNHYFVAVKQS